MEYLFEPEYIYLIECIGNELKWYSISAPWHKDVECIYRPGKKPFHVWMAKFDLYDLLNDKGEIAGFYFYSYNFDGDGDDLVYDTFKDSSFYEFQKREKDHGEHYLFLSENRELQRGKCWNSLVHPWINEDGELIMEISNVWENCKLPPTLPVTPLLSHEYKLFDSES